MRVTDKYVFFWGSEFSNFYPAEFVIDGQKFNCSEQYFMWSKAKFFGDEEIAKQILDATEPIIQKKLGRKVAKFDADKWMEVCKDVMYQAVKAKFTQNEDLKNIILKYKGKTFVEASPYDGIWGVKLAEDDPRIDDEKNWNGLNLLGQVLTELSEVI